MALVKSRMDIQDIRDAFDKLMTGNFSESAKEDALDDVLGCLYGFDRVVDFDDLEDNMRQTEGCVNDTIINACISLFAKPYQNNVVTLATWFLPHSPAHVLCTSSRDILDDAILMGGSLGLSTIIWPFEMKPDDSPDHCHYFLCVLRPNRTATILDSGGKGALYTGVVKDALAATPWSQWRVVVGESAKHRNAFDAGLYCIANAAYTIAEHKLPAKINAKFWRIACWSAIGVQDDSDYLANTPIFDHLHGCPEAEVRLAVQQIRDKEGLAVLKTLHEGPKFKWWIYWEDKLCTLIQAYEDLEQAHANLEKKPTVYEEVRVDKMEEDFIKMLQNADLYERCSERTTLELAMQIATRERLATVVSRIERLDELIPAIMNRV